jgi:tetratricopeptide (TPR) repeat protein
MKIPLFLLRSISICVFLMSGSACVAQTSEAALPAGCKVNAAGPSDAEAALYVEDWSKAARLYRVMQQQDAGSLEAQAGLVRVQLGEGKIADALKAATDLAKATPQSVVAETVLGETYLRRGEIDMASPILTKALSLDPCYGRARLEAARLESLSGYHASAAKHLAQAHALNPNDEQITVAWLFSLAPAQRYPLLKEFVEHAKYLNSDDREDLKSNLLEGEAKMNSHCTVSSPAAGTQTTLFENPIISKDPSAPSIDVALNGKKHRLRFSTSDGDVFFPWHTAQALGLTPLVKVSYAQLYRGGRLNYYFANLASLRIGDVEFKNCIVKVLDESGNGYEAKVDADTNPSGSDGSIGAMFLADFLVHMDSMKKQLTLTPLPPIPANLDSTGLPLWSDVSKSGGDPVPSINGGAWGQRNRTVNTEMKSWTSLVSTRDRIWLPTFVGAGPAVLFLLELSDPWPRISTNAVNQAARIESIANGKSAPPFHGYFIDFAGLMFPNNSWTVVRYDEFSKHLKLETSGTIGLEALRQTTFTLDLRDNLVHFTYDPSKAFH